MLSSLTGANKTSRFIPPPIPLRKDEPEQLLKGTYLSMELKSNPDNDDSPTFKKDVVYFKDGTPEEFLDWEENLTMVLRGQDITIAAHKYSMAKRLLKGSALANFENHW